MSEVLRCSFIQFNRELFFIERRLIYTECSYSVVRLPPMRTRIPVNPWSKKCSATLTIIASPNCTIVIPTISPPIIGYNKTIFILPQENASSTYSIVSTFTTFSQMSAQTTFTTITVSNAEVKTTVTSGNSTITTLTCPAYA